MNHSPLLLSLFVLVVSLGRLPLAAAEDTSKLPAVESPNGRLRVTFRLDPQGRPTFDVAHRDLPLVAGVLGLEFAESGLLQEGLKIVGTQRQSRDETYAIPVGKASSARDRHNELVVSLEETDAPRRKLDIAFRAFDDGIALRYMIPKQEPLSTFTITDEHTLLSFSGDPVAKVLPLRNYTTPYEWYYQTLRVLGDSAGPARRPADAA